MPAIGYGTWKLTGDDAQKCVKHAIQTGYRLIDTAAIYGNEKEVGEGIKASGIDREDLFVTTKLWNTDLDYDSAFGALDTSLKKLGMDYVDLYLIHWPASEKRVEAWRAFIEMNQKGKALHIGVSNFTVDHLKELKEKYDVQPVVNQIEFHPHIFNEQQELLHYCEDNDITIEAYSPLAQGDLIDNPIVEEVAEQTGKTPGQVLIRWAIEHGAVPIPKSGNFERIEENFEVFDFELSDQEIDKLDSISSGERVTHDPAEHG